MSITPENSSLTESEYFQDFLLSVDDDLRNLFQILEEELIFDFVRNFRSWYTAFEAKSNVWPLFNQALLPIKSRLIAVADSPQSASTFAGSDFVRAVVSRDAQLHTGIERKDKTDDISLIDLVLHAAPSAAFLSAPLTSQGREIIIEKGGVLARLTLDELKILIAIWHRWIVNGDDLEIAVDMWIERYGMSGEEKF